MIIELSDKVCNQVIKLEQRNQGAATNQSLQDTATYLVELHKKVDKLTNFIKFNKTKIKEDDKKRLSDDTTSIQEELRASLDLFKQSPRQVSQLHNIGIRVETEHQNAQAAWLVSFQEEMDPIFKAIGLAVKFLPSNEQLEINSLQNEIEAFYRNPPRTLNETAKLINVTGRLKNYIRIAELDPAVTKFLTKVQDGIASLADIDKDVAAWIKKEKSQKRFKITLSN